jgi:hypothetical protein
LWHEVDLLLQLFHPAKLNHSTPELNFRADNLDDKKEFHNPCIDQPAFVTGQTPAPDKPLSSP